MFVCACIRESVGMYVFLRPCVLVDVCAQKFLARRHSSTRGTDYALDVVLSSYRASVLHDPVRVPGELFHFALDIESAMCVYAQAVA